MKRKSSLKPVICPECGSDQIHLTCTHVRDDIRVRYKSCKDCSHKFVTEQAFTQETVVKKKRGGYLPGNEDAAKLSEDDVIFIRQQLTDGIYTAKDLALQYEITDSTISKIRTGKTWKHLVAAQ